MNDQQQLAQKGITQAEVDAQLARFRTGFPFLSLDGAAAIGAGILAPSAEEEEAFLAAWDAYTADAAHTVSKFVPASGAASRMFKDLFAFLDAEYDAPQTKAEQTFFQNLEHAAFYDALDDACQLLYGESIVSLVEDARYKEVVAALLGEEGLNYGQLPKGLLQFHAYLDAARTPVEEHMVEGALYARSGKGEVNLHFTVSPAHRALFQDLVEEKRAGIEADTGAHFHISFSEQKSSTDTIAANPDGTPFRNADGTLLFRPGGHGALLANLSEIAADVVFIKNIDNVVPDRLKDSTVRYKKLLAGVLVTLQKEAFRYTLLLEQGAQPREVLEEVLQFVEQKLFCHSAEAASLSDDALQAYLLRKLRRPMRVCGMVKNVGEPGGGPFRAYSPDGTVALQILESTQIDKTNPEAVAMFEKGTHFNPVDLVCALRDAHGESYDLPAFTDPQTGFISQKSKDGRDLLALELPGLWNGAMSDWSTIFVEVPLETFNPVKTVNDLYRAEHQ